MCLEYSQGIAIKGRNMIKDKREKKYYKNLAKIRKIIETRFSQSEGVWIKIYKSGFKDRPWCMSSA